MSADSRLILLSGGLWYRDQEVDVFAADAAARIRSLHGPPIFSYKFPGVGRTAELFSTGMILLTEDDRDRLLSLIACFDSTQGSPYQALPEVPVFDGVVECGGHQFVAGMSEDEVRKIGEVRGMPGAPSMDLGRLHLGFFLKKRISPLGSPYGEPRLVQLSAEWGGVLGFHPQRQSNG